MSQRFKLEVTADGLTAFFTLLPMEGIHPISEEDIRQFLSQNGVHYGIHEHVIKLAVRQNFLERTEIARGKEATIGTSARFEYLIEEPESHRPKLLEDGRVDYRELNLHRTVDKGMPLMRRLPPEPGRPGIKVTGETIPAPKGIDYHLMAAQGTTISENDPNILVARKSGKPTRLKNSVRIDDVLELDEVGISTGNIDFDGSVIVYKNVNSGSKIRASGDIIVHGFVEDALIETEGNLVIKGSMFGRDQSHLLVQGNLHAHYLQNTRVDCGGNASIEEGLFYCETKILGALYLGQKGGKGQINGGNVFCHASLNANVLGSKSLTDTFVSLGTHPFMYEKSQLLKAELKALKSELEELVKAMIYLRRNAEGNSATLTQIEAKRNTCLEQLRALTNESNSIEEKLRMAYQIGTEARIRMMVFPGVRIMIGKAKYDVRDELSAVKFRHVLTPQGEDVHWSQL